ncbi:hypothetical protein Y1Q_0016111 [Alligator mississippiensis]|uniref:Uncharacterized protein n=1 Tax=Alligator mississippiensis TaxID=8496 RepID=A0A151P1M6_ALLMI|nr:hypothetical protein Y1Q_0016111 [Alligator mississippiensis]
MPPCGLEPVILAEDGVRYDQAVLGTFDQEQDTIGIGLPHAILDDSSAPDFMVMSNLNVEVNQKNDFVIPGDGGKDAVEIGVEPFLDLLIGIQGAYQGYCS